VNSQSSKAKSAGHNMNKFQSSALISMEGQAVGSVQRNNRIPEGETCSWWATKQEKVNFT